MTRPSFPLGVALVAGGALCWSFAGVVTRSLQANPWEIVFWRSVVMALTIGGRDFERPGATGMMKGSGIFMHDSTADRPADEFAGINTIHTGGEHASHLLLPRIPSSPG